MKRSLPINSNWIKIVKVTFIQLLALSIFSIASAANPESMQHQVTGTVTDENGKSLPGVGIKFKNGVASTTTDVNGKYSINIPDGKGTLIFTYIGYAVQEVAVNNRTLITIKLLPEATSLNDVVVVGYGTQKRERVTSAIASIKSENFVKGSVTDAAQLIRGQSCRAQRGYIKR